MSHPSLQLEFGRLYKFLPFLQNSGLFRASFVGDCINSDLFGLFLADFWLSEKKAEFLAEVRNFGLSGSTDSGKSEKVSFLVKIWSEKGPI